MLAARRVHRTRDVGHQRDAFPFRLALRRRLAGLVRRLLAIQRVVVHRRDTLTIVVGDDEAIVGLPDADGLTDFDTLWAVGARAVVRVLIAASVAAAPVVAAAPS